MKINIIAVHKEHGVWTVIASGPQGVMLKAKGIDLESVIYRLEKEILAIEEKLPESKTVAVNNNDDDEVVLI